MIILDDEIVFDWNEANRNKNMLKHRVFTQEAEEAFKNKPVITFKDEKHSTDKEIRYGLLGKTSAERKLSIAFTTRGQKVRVIMARDQSKKERKIYEEKSKNNS